MNHDFAVLDNDLLLRADFGTARPSDLAELTVMRFMSDFREAMWGICQQAISKLDFDFVGYAGEHFDRLERTAASHEFRDALTAIRERA